MNSINAVGWHFHFISDDKKVGGHVLNLSAKNINANVDSTNGFYVTIPNNEMFNKFDPIIDQSKDIKKLKLVKNNIFSKIYKLKTSQITKSN